MPVETAFGPYAVSDDPARFDLTRGYAWISGDSYWAGGIPLQTFERAVRGSLTIGVYDPTGAMAAMARVVTDRATFGLIGDVFVDRAHRGAGLGKAIMAYIRAHPDLQGLRRLMLATRDAHGLYAQYGFTPLSGVEKWMEVWTPDVYRAAAPRSPDPQVRTS
ncbi:GNAT family N-acetyltransferase [Caulobacter sp. KR2-114]|uniref:GNAT family N-acetyltransferase n=1 Tax=Caulobacter sp. KR2-114 TaxID=3400912 RepID=UPI003C0E38B6